MSRTSAVSAILLLAIVGLIDSLYVAHGALAHTALNCSINGLDGCNVVAQSAYSRFLGIPLAVYGVAFYVLILATAYAMLKSFRPSCTLLRGLGLFSTLGALSSVYFMYLQIFVIKALCIYCAGSFAVSVLIWIMSIYLLRTYKTIVKEHIDVTESKL